MSQHWGPLYVLEAQSTHAGIRAEVVVAAPCLAELFFLFAESSELSGIALCNGGIDVELRQPSVVWYTFEDDSTFAATQFDHSPDGTIITCESSAENNARRTAQNLCECEMLVHEQGKVRAEQMRRVFVLPRFRNGRRTITPCTQPLVVDLSCRSLSEFTDFLAFRAYFEALGDSLDARAGMPMGTLKVKSWIEELSAAERAPSAGLIVPAETEGADGPNVGVLELDRQVGDSTFEARFHALESPKLQRGTRFTRRVSWDAPEWNGSETVTTPRTIEGDVATVVSTFSAS